MEVFLDFLTDNYIYFLIAAGVLTLALIGLLVSSKKKGKDAPVAEVKNVEATTIEPMETTEIRPEVTPQQVQTPITPVTPVFNEVPNINPTTETIPNIQPMQENSQQNEAFSFGNNTPNEIPNVEPIHVAPQQNETISFGNSIPNNVPNSVPNVTPIQETPATYEPNNQNNTNVQTYDEPIMQINQTTDSNFHIDGNTNNNNM
jgi:hypothetical protein